MRDERRLGFPGFLDLRDPGDPRRAAWLLLLFAVALLLGVQGQRGLWDPDEGRYAEAARGMLETGDWLVPRLDGQPHLTKPPLTYWAIAGGMAILGRNEHGVRLYLCLATLLTLALTSALAGRLGGPARAHPAGLIYATFALPHIAAHAATPDALLVLFTTAGVVARVFERDTPAGLRKDLLHAGAWAAFGLAFLTKGLPALLPGAALLVHAALCPPPPGRGTARLATRAAGIALFLGLGLGWYGWLVWRDPSLAGYFVGEEVLGRIFTSQHRRHAEWYGALEVYAPAILGGCLPWVALLPRTFAWLRGSRPAEPVRMLLLLLIVVPLVAFTLVSSRLHLYVLPIFPPLAAAMALAGETGRPRWAPGARGVLAWAAFLVTLRAVLAYGTWDRDSRGVWRSLPSPQTAKVYQLCDENGASWGLDFYANGRVERCLWDPEESRGVLIPGFDAIALEARRTGVRVIVVIRERERDLARERLTRLGIAPDIRDLSRDRIAAVIPSESP